MSKTAPSNKQNGTFSNPLKDWENDDLLLKPEARHEAELADPRAFRVLDWPELRALFEHNDKLANEAKRASRCIGVIAACLAGFGAASLALAPLLPKLIQKPAIVTCLGAVALGTVLGGWHWWRGTSRHDWLRHRTWTERLRQLYFQIVINNIELAARAMSDDAALAEWSKLKERKLASFSFGQQREDCYHPDKIYLDHVNEHAWLAPEWRDPKLLSSGVSRSLSAEISALMLRLDAQRIKVQLRYTQASLQKSLATPHLRKAFLTVGADLSTVLLAVFAVMAAIATLRGSDATAALALSAAAGALGLLARTLDQGLRSSIDAERMDWYLDAIQQAERDFQTDKINEKIMALRRFEVHVYQEMRHFLTSHKNEKYLS